MNSAGLTTLEDSLKTITAYKYALDQADIVAITDPKGFITYVNDNFCKISGYSSFELIGKDHRIINSGYHPKDFIKEIWTTIANGKVWKGEIKNKARNGCYYWVDTTIVPFLNDEGKPYQYMAIRHDITEKKEVEERLKANNAELEAFSFMVAHDLRAPLRVIKGILSLFTKQYDENMDDEARSLMDMVDQNIRRMGQLIEDLLKFSRLGQASLVPVNCNIRSLIEDIISSMKNEGIEIKAEIIISDMPPVKCDLNLARQVWANLISNAIKYSSQAAHPVIEIGGYKSDEGIVYFIKDNGAGFNMKHADKLFKPFQRLHSDNEFKGTGVGLALADRIIKKHGGRMWAHSEEGKGAAFYFSLPV